MWHTRDKHKSQLGLMKCAALMALGAGVAEKGLNAFSLLTSSISDLFIDWLTDWLTGGLSLQICGQLMQVIMIRGQMLQYVIQLSWRWGQSIFLKLLIKCFLRVLVIQVSHGNSRQFLGLDVVCCWICQHCDICAEPWEGSTVSAGVSMWQERCQPSC